ncbi:MAG: macro domain-containing protein [Clostridia bacterium]|nr:macro domain-containing protein [Clostridia bacterium]
MIRNVKGNILNCKEEIIVHQVNCQGIMGGGLAKQIASRYPDTERDYKNFCDYYNNEYNKVKGAPFLTGEIDHTICNLFSQKPNFDTDYEAMEEGLRTLKEHCKQYKRSIAIPYGIGCGIANGDWNIVYKIIEEVFSDYEVTLYRLEV